MRYLPKFLTTSDLWKTYQITFQIDMSGISVFLPPIPFKRYLKINLTGSFLPRTCSDLSGTGWEGIFSLSEFYLLQRINLTQELKQEKKMMCYAHLGWGEREVAKLLSIKCLELGNKVLGHPGCCTRQKPSQGIRVQSIYTSKILGPHTG